MPNVREHKRKIKKEKYEARSNISDNRPKTRYEIGSNEDIDYDITSQREISPEEAQEIGRVAEMIEYGDFIGSTFVDPDTGKEFYSESPYWKEEGGVIIIREKDSGRMYLVKAVWDWKKEEEVYQIY